MPLGTDQSITSEVTSKYPNYSEHYAFVDKVIDLAFADLRYTSVDLYKIQFAQIRQLIYLSITIATVFGTAIISSVSFNVSHFATLGYVFGITGVVLAIGSTVYGIWSLRGENGGRLLFVSDSYAAFVEQSYGTNESRSTYSTKMRTLVNLDQAIQVARNRIKLKGPKIRRLNTSVIVSATLGTIGCVFLFVSYIVTAI